MMNETIDYVRMLEVAVEEGLAGENPVEETLADGWFVVRRTNAIGTLEVAYILSGTATAPAVTPFVTYLSNAGVPSNQRGATDDPDADSVPNLLEFALGLNPTIADPSGLPVATQVGSLFTLTYDRTEPSAVAYEVQTSTDLTNPSSWTATGVTQGTPAANGVTAATVPVGTGPRFLRLRVTLVP